MYPIWMIGDENEVRVQYIAFKCHKSKKKKTISVIIMSLCVEYVSIVYSD